MGGRGRGKNTAVRPVANGACLRRPRRVQLPLRKRPRKAQIDAVRADLLEEGRFSRSYGEDGTATRTADDLELVERVSFLEPSSHHVGLESRIDMDHHSRQILGELLAIFRHPVLALVVGPVFDRRDDRTQRVDPALVEEPEIQM